MALNQVHIQQVSGPTVAEMEVEIVERRLGGGKVLEPMLLVMGDRATTSIGQEVLDVVEIAERTAREWFEKNLRHVDPDQHLCCQVELKPGSEELTSLFLADQRIFGANDTSAAVGYAPLSETEQLVLEAEHFLNSGSFKKRFPETGEDVKIMGVRSGSNLELTVAVPLLDRYVHREEEYFRRKGAVCDVLLSHLRNYQQELEGLTVSLNALDRRGVGMAGMYLSVIGTSAEDADSGEVGRGNQVNGLIALNRPRGSEAAAGKNPVSHIGKIYNVLAHLLATKIHTQVSGVREVTLWLCSRIGEPIDRPGKISVQVHLQSGFLMGDVTGPIAELVAQDLEQLPTLCQELAEGHHPIC